MDLVLGISLGNSLSALDLVDSFDVINIYGPYLNRIPFWDTIFNHSLMRGEKLIIGGDLSFSLGQAKVWGPHARSDSLTNYFTRNLVERN